MTTIFPFICSAIIRHRNERSDESCLFCKTLEPKDQAIYLAVDLKVDFLYRP